MDSCPNLSLNLNLEPSIEPSNIPKEGEMMEVISKIYSDNRKIRRMVAEIFRINSSLMQHITTNNGVINDNSINNSQIRKRKFGDLEVNCCSCGNQERLRMMNSKPKVSTVFIRVDPIDSSLVVKDGYQWRKYGQKVTRDNPSPRAYFKCSFAPLCPVKKKVQKSVEDPRILVVTYEGEHNHKKPFSIVASSNIISSDSSLINLSPSSQDNVNVEEQDPQGWVLEQMTSSLTKDPSFTSTLASIISAKVLQHTSY